MACNPDGASRPGFFRLVRAAVNPCSANLFEPGRFVCSNAASLKPDFGIRIHDEGTIADDGFVDGLLVEEQGDAGSSAKSSKPAVSTPCI
ncbi:hypothetical protein [Crenobacter cavernae]|uniref:hypothetical protein n=1 Tax=Crenobacter cavernae TaxID=2290923 RepID=UPI001FE8A3A0|nr:hypothetical protein [Crenobacter cavernae]